MDTLIGADSPSIELFFNIFIYGIETSVIPWDKLLYPCIVEVCHLALEPHGDTHLVSRDFMQIFTVLIFVIYDFYE